MVRALSPQFRSLLPEGGSTKEPKVGTASPQSSLPAEILLNRLSYSHLELIVDQDAEPKRHFYAAESIQGSWSDRELRPQIRGRHLAQTMQRTSESKNVPDRPASKTSMSIPAVRSFRSKNE